MSDDEVLDLLGDGDELVDGSVHEKVGAMGHLDQVARVAGDSAEGPPSVLGIEVESVCGEDRSVGHEGDR